jgi:hypothetical protein
MSGPRPTPLDAGDAGLANLHDRHLENPFAVLALAPTASAAEVERQGEKLLAMLAAGLQEAQRYPTPSGARARTPELVRASLAELRDPHRRLRHEWWARGWPR